jgi:hypothetical protein
LTRKNIAIVCAVPGLAAACAVPAAAAPGGAEAPAVSSATSGGTLAARSGALLGRTLRFRGTLNGARPGAGVVVERLRSSGAWVRTATATVGADGRFLARWRTDHIGTFRVRAVPAGVGEDARAASVAPSTDVTVYRGARATWYGPGFYGRRTSCGMTMTRELLGVAHRSLPCGTQVALFYRGATITVPVVDRGPYANGASWDLTAATAKALGFKVTDHIGALSLRGRAALPAAPPPVVVDGSGGATAPGA